MGLQKFGDKEKCVGGQVRIAGIWGIQTTFLTCDPEELGQEGILVPGMFGLGWSEGLGQTYLS